MYIKVRQVQSEYKCLYEKPRIFMNILKSMVPDKNKLYCYILCVTFCQFFSL